MRHTFFYNKKKKEIDILLDEVDISYQEYKKQIEELEENEASYLVDEYDANRKKLR